MGNARSTVWVGSMFGQIWSPGRKVKSPNFKNFVRTKMEVFGYFWDQAFMGIIRGPTIIMIRIRRKLIIIIIM